MSRPTIQIVQIRWADVQVGDIIMDHQWRQPRWVTITKVEPYGTGVSVWFGGDHTGRGLQCPGANLIDLQQEIQP